MKLNEIKQLNEQHFETDRYKIYDMLKEFGYTRMDIKVGSDGRVNLTFPFGKTHDFAGRYFTDGEGKLKIAFGKIEGINCDFGGLQWQSLDGFPTHIVDGNFRCSDAGLTSYKGLPKSIINGDLDLRNNKITSLVGISEYFEHLATVDLDLNQITEGGLGILSIPGAPFFLHNGSVNIQKYYGLSKAFKIIDSYIGRPDDMFECQAELIENGFEKIAQL